MPVSIKISRQLAYGTGIIVIPGLVFGLIVLSAEIGVTFSKDTLGMILSYCASVCRIYNGVGKKNQHGEGKCLEGASNAKRGTCHYMPSHIYPI